MDGELGESILPDFKLVGTAAVALPLNSNRSLLNSGTSLAQWSIGPDFIVGWSSKYPNLPLNGILTEQGSANYQSLSRGTASLKPRSKDTRAEFGQSLFYEESTRRPCLEQDRAGADSTTDATRDAHLYRSRNR